MSIETRPFDPAEFIDSADAAAAYLTEAFKTGDPAFVTDSIGVVARALGMTRIAKAAGVSRESLYRSLSAEGHPEFATVMKVLSALGVEIKAVPAQDRHHEAA
jgi:probable addiction module antidote protein